MRPLVVIRHGETTWSRDHRHTGHTDLPLTAAGEAQARDLGDRLRSFTFDHVLTSPLQRARATCELAGFAAVMRIEPNLQEWDCGDYEGLTREEIRAARPGWAIFRDGCPNGDSPHQIAARADALISSLRQLHGSVALFSHGHFLCALAARWIRLPVAEGARLRLDAAAIGILDVEHDNANEPSVARWNWRPECTSVDLE